MRSAQSVNSRRSSLVSINSSSRIAMLALVACAGQAIAQTFTGAVPPGPGNPYSWFGTLDTGTVCGGPSDHIIVNNWGNQWCSNPGTATFPSGIVNLAGFDVACFADVAVAGGINPSGGQLRLGVGQQSIGSFTNNGLINMNRGATSSILHASVITNNGVFSDAGGGNGTSVGNLTINNSGTITNSAGFYDMTVVPGQPWSGPCVINSTGTIQSVTNGTNNGSGGLNGWTISVNAGSVNLQTNCSLELPNCTITSQPAATWTVTGGTSTLNIQNSSLQGTFNGSTAGSNGIIFNGTINIPENTTFNVSGNGVYRWVAPVFNIASGKTLTNAGRMWAIGPHSHPTNGNFTNIGTFEHGGNVILNGSTYTNAASGTYNLNDGLFTATGTNQIINNGLMHTPDGNGAGTTFVGVNLTNTGAIRNDGAAGSIIRFTTGTNITSTPGAQWLTSTASNGMDFSGVSMQGTFNGSNTGTTIRMNEVNTFSDNTTFNIGGNGIYRWVGDTFNIASGKIVTNAGRMWALSPHSHPTNGNFTNTGIFEHGGNIVLNNSTYTNAASGTYNFYNGVFTATGSNQIVNNGLMQSTGANGGMNFQGVTVSNNGTIRNDSTDSANIQFTNGTNVTSSPNARWFVTGGSNNGFDFIDASIAGTFTGSTIDNNDWRINQSLNVTDNTTFNITGGGLTRWVATTITIAPGKILRNTGRMGHLNGGAYTGTVINDGVFEYYNGGTSFTNHALTNNGTINWYNQEFNNTSGSNSFTNNGTINVQPNNFNSGVNVPTTNNGLIRIGDATNPAGWGSNFTTLQQGLSGIVRFVAPTEPSSLLYVPGGSTISGGMIEGNGAVSIDNLGTATFGNVLLDANDRASGSGRLQLRGFANLSNDTRSRVRIDNVGANTSIECWRNIDCNGTLELDFRSGFTPAVGNSWTVVGAQSRSGTFDNVSIVGGNSGIQVSTSYTSTSVIVTITNAGCDSIDFNNDGSLFDPQDIEAFLSVYSEGPCIPDTATCSDIDFNNDTSVFDPCDINAFLVVYSEGPCTPCGV